MLLEFFLEGRERNGKVQVCFFFFLVGIRTRVVDWSYVFHKMRVGWNGQATVTN